MEAPTQIGESHDPFGRLGPAGRALDYPWQHVLRGNSGAWQATPVDGHGRPHS